MSFVASRLVPAALPALLVLACSGESVVGAVPFDATVGDAAPTYDTNGTMDAPDVSAPDVVDAAPEAAFDAPALADLPDVAPPGSCRDNTDCGSNEFGFRVCDQPSGRCVLCTVANRDACTPTQYCTAANRCEAGCDADAQCASHHCDLAHHVCVACAADDQCAAGMVCSPSAQLCVPGCNPAHACPADQGCCAGACLNTRIDPSNCGVCGRACSIAQGTASCVAGECAVASCNTGFGDCDAIASNGCETDLTSSGTSCGRCGNACVPGANASAACAGGACRVTCDPGFADCNGSAADGCEANLADAASCGSCATHCTGATPLCTVTAGVAACVSGCASTEARCGGACVSVATSTDNCGGCATVCPERPNASRACLGGRCGFTCTTGFADCNNDPSDGCEARLDDVTNCGTCGTVCHGATNATPVCSRGACGLTCTSGYGDCDGSATNGCETSTLSSVTNCGACAAACSAGPNAVVACVGGRCRSGCNAGFADCDGNPGNGCEVNILTSTASCGACGLACPSGASSTAVCAGGVCGITCAAGTADCDANPVNGCEVDLTSALACGLCSNRCAGATPVCVTGSSGSSCGSGCAVGQARCGATCVDTQSSVDNCGGCGNACPGGANATRTCTAGACGLTCAPGTANCDGNASNGCETNTASDPANCGACRTACGPMTCVAGACIPPRSCLELARNAPSTASGTYAIDADGPGGDASFNAWCDMSTSGGGWTEIFFADPAGYTTTTLDYQVTSRALRNAATDVLVTFRQGDHSVLPNWARFTMPNNWRSQSPFRYTQVDETIAVSVNGAAEVTTLLRYGYNNWPTLCTDPWSSTSSVYGRICFTGTVAPYFNGFGVGASLCPDSSQSYNAVGCAANRRYSIAVR